MGIRMPTSMPWQALLALLVIFVLGTTNADTAAADNVVVRAGIHQNFGRLVFDWQKQVGFYAGVKDRQLTIRFDRNIDPKFGNIIQDLDPYISSAILAGDGQTVLVSLNNDFKVRTSRIGSLVVVDLVKLEPPSVATVPRKAGVTSKTPRSKKQKSAVTTLANPSPLPPSVSALTKKSD